MGNFNEFLPTIFGVLFLVIRRLFGSISDKINNSEVYKQDTLRVLEEIRDELKELNRNNSK